MFKDELFKNMTPEQKKQFKSNLRNFMDKIKDKSTSEYVDPLIEQLIERMKQIENYQRENNFKVNLGLWFSGLTLLVTIITLFIIA